MKEIKYRNGINLSHKNVVIGTVTWRLKSLFFIRIYIYQKPKHLYFPPKKYVYPAYVFNFPKRKVHKKLTIVILVFKSCLQRGNKLARDGSKKEKKIEPKPCCWLAAAWNQKHRN